MASNYQRGRAFEYRTRDQLLKRGAVYVMRAAQSKGIADLAAFWPVQHLGMFPAPPVPVPPWLVQCKYSIHGGGTLPPAERAALIELAAKTGCVPVFARPGKNGRGVVFTDLSNEEEVVV